MKSEHDGFVIYCQEAKRKIPIGVVSEEFECMAMTDYIPNRVKKFVVEIEDKRFYNHSGIDFRGIIRALVKNIQAGKIVQGGSTITQQLARNIIKDNDKTILRKLKEVFKAVQIERKYSKDEILKLYFNYVYFGKNLRGIRSAGLYYFEKEVDKLSQPELLYLLAILRGPNYYIGRPEITMARYMLISNSLHKRELISRSRNEKNLKTTIKLKNNYLQSVKSVTVPFIAKLTDNKQKKIVSTIDLRFQKFAIQFVSDSKYPVSIIALRKNKVVAFFSSYGTDYPFISKSNVGSTLKPFLYCYLRDNGVSKFEKFNAYRNDMNWEVREVAHYKSQLNLQEALFFSNNNSFLNAANKVGVESSLKFLARVFNRTEAEFYPSSILGATRNGITLYELALAYSTFFTKNCLTESKIECLSILNRVFVEKLDFKIENAFLKTGTTNNNKERFAILGNADLTFALLRNENAINDKSKEVGFMNQISRSFSSLF
jgi:penicillin-binding protein 1A